MYDADYIRTPFYRTVSVDGREDTHVAAVNRGSVPNVLPNSNYRPYQLFALRTRLQPIVNRLFPSEYEGEAKYAVRYNMRMLDNKLTNIIQLYDGKECVMIKGSDREYLQRVVNEILGNNPNMSLLISNNTVFMNNPFSDGRHTLISDCWSRRIIPFLRLPRNYNGQMRSSSEYQIGGLYIDLSMKVNYQRVYNDLYMSIVKTIDRLYNEGNVVLPASFSPIQLEKWNVRSVGRISSVTYPTQNVVFAPNWIDRRLTDPVGGPVAFIQKHLIGGSNKILLDVGGDDIIRRHQIAKSFESSGLKFQFRDHFVEVDVDNLRMSQRAASLVDNAKYIIVGKVFNMYSIQPQLFNTILTVYPTSDSKLGIKPSNMIGYQVDDSNNRYCLSCEVPYDSDVEYYYRALNRWYQSYVNEEPVLPLIEGTEISVEPSITPPIEPTVRVDTQQPTVARRRPRFVVDDLGLPTSMPYIRKPSEIKTIRPMLPPISGVMANLGLTSDMVAVGA